MVTPRAAVALLLTLLCLSGCGEQTGAPARPAAPEPVVAAPPAPDAALPREPAALADALAGTTLALRDEIERWRRDGDPAAGPPPEAVTLLALYQQRIYRRIAAARRLGDRVLALLPTSVASEARDTVAARRALISIPASGNRRPKIRAAEPQPADRLRAHYAAAQRRFGVGWHVLAAVNFVETGFGRLRNESTAGARGPMQFMPATLARLRARREYPRPARRDPRRRELPACERCAGLLPPRAVPLQPLVALRRSGAALRPPHPPRPALLLRLLLVAGLRAPGRRGPAHHRPLT